MGHISKWNIQSLSVLEAYTDTSIRMFAPKEMVEIKRWVQLRSSRETITKEVISLGGRDQDGITNSIKEIFSFLVDSHLWMWELDHKEGWTPKNWYFWTVVLEKTLENPLDCKGIKPVNPKENQFWIFIRRTVAEAEAPILWLPDVTLEKTLMLGKIEGRRKRGRQRMRWLYSITDSMDMSLSKLREMAKDGKAWRAPVHGGAKSLTRLSDWTTTMADH